MGYRGDGLGPGLGSGGIGNVQIELSPNYVVGRDGGVAGHLEGDLEISTSIWGSGSAVDSATTSVIADSNCCEVTVKVRGGKTSSGNRHITAHCPFNRVKGERSRREDQIYLSFTAIAVNHP